MGEMTEAVVAGSAIIVWSTTMVIASTLRASSTPLTSVISPRGAKSVEVIIISFVARLLIELA